MRLIDSRNSEPEAYEEELSSLPFVNKGNLGIVRINLALDLLKWM
jgi:hypothetical protein